MKRLTTILAITAMATLTQCGKAPKYVALSFDDGVNNSKTIELLDLLEEQGVPASFFVEGRYLTSETQPIIRRALSQRIDIENHAFSHPHMSELTKEQIESQIASTDSLIELYAGRKPEFFRPPYIDHNDLMHQVIGHTFICGFSCQDWDENVTSQQRIDAMLSHAQDGIIFLLHDHPGKGKLTIDALKTVIPELKAQGYTFITVPELFKLRGGVPASQDTLQIWNGITPDCKNISL